MDRIAIIGATGGIGGAIARRLIREGRSVLLIGRDNETLSRRADELSQPFATVDLSESQSLEDALRHATESHGGLGGLVNCVGSVLLKPAHATADDEFRRTIETNLFSSFATVRVGAKLLRERGGPIVLFASAAAEIGISNHEAVAAAKAGVIGLARSAAATYAPHNIRVNVVSSGFIRTDMTRRIWENPAAAVASTAKRSSPTGATRGSPG